MAKRNISWEEIITVYGADEVLTEVTKQMDPANIGDILYHQLDNDEMLRMLTSIQILKDTE